MAETSAQVLTRMINEIRSVFIRKVTAAVPLYISSATKERRKEGRGRVGRLSARRWIFLFFFIFHSSCYWPGLLYIMFL